MVRHIVFAIFWAIVFLLIGVALYAIGVIAFVVLTGKRDGADGAFQFLKLGSVNFQHILEI